jgi:hypothetical protein
MVKSCKRKCKRNNKTKRHRQRGGELAGNPPSAWGWGMGTLGDGWTQFTNSLTLQSNQNGNINQSNNIVPVGKGVMQNMPPKFGGRKRKYRGGNSNDLMPEQMPMPVALVPITAPTSTPTSTPTGGKKRRTRGGNVVAQAIVPASLILMNNALGKYSRSRKPAQKRF